MDMPGDQLGPLLFPFEWVHVSCLRSEFFNYRDVSFDMGLEVTYPFDRKYNDKHFDIMGLGPEAVVFKKKWAAMLSVEKYGPPC